MSSYIERVANYKLNNTVFRVTYGDITQIQADALVSSDDNYLSMGGGVSASILKAGGDIIIQEARKHTPLKIGEVAVTSAGILSAKYIFHAVTIDYSDMTRPSEGSVHAATLKCMQLADTLGVRVIAFPSLGTGVAGFPFELAADVMTRTIAEYLMGTTKIEMAIITLFARERVSQSNLNTFYERAVALASVSTQSKQLNVLLSDLENIIGRINKPNLIKRFTELRFELEKTQKVFEERPESLERLEQIQDQSGLSEISKQIVSISSETQEMRVWADKELEEKVLKTKLNGLLSQLNIQISHQNRYEIEKAKYGGIGVPPRLETAIEELKQEIKKLESQISEIRSQLVNLLKQDNI
jgi:O-acetyl-ADP-ribose deacetylase (regulator of RNase III)